MTATNLDLSKLSLLQAMDLAVAVEEEAHERYLEFADQLAAHHTPEAAAFFAKMARIEALHRDHLAARRAALFGEQRSGLGLADIFDIEAPEYDGARVYMTVHDALTVALTAEEKAHAFFAKAAPVVTDPEARALFAELAEEEVEHQHLVRLEMAKYPPDPDVDPRDYEDEPHSPD